MGSPNSAFSALSPFPSFHFPRPFPGRREARLLRPCKPKKLPNPFPPEGGSPIFAGFPASTGTVPVNCYLSALPRIRGIPRPKTPNRDPPERASSQQLANDHRQDAAVAVVFHFDRGVDSHLHGKPLRPMLLGHGLDRDFTAWAEFIRR